MAGMVLDGKALSTQLEGELAVRVKKIVERTKGVTPVLATILWSLALTAIFAPFALRAYARRTGG